ncbi:MAG: antitoxin [Bacteroides sp. SM23_62_1]|nr:MAG: antitoxin [Bacteroides sp. SM23_62_1]
MKPEIKSRLEDIKRSIDEIDEFLPDKKDFYLFDKDLKTKKAIERNLEIIGEALSRVLKENLDIKISDSRKIVDTRNRIIHGYNSITSDVLWLIITKSLPLLKKEILKLLE